MLMPIRYPQHILEAMEKDKPSKDPVYWAKKGCRDCLGRGVVGKVTQTVGNGNKIVNEQLCSCAKKSFAAWQAKWVEEHNNKVEVTTLPEVSVSALNIDMLQQSPVEERLARIDTLCQPLRVEIESLKSKRDAISAEFKFPLLNQQVLDAQKVVEQATDEITKILHETDLLDSKANDMYTEVKTLRRQAEELRTVVRNSKQSVLDQRVSELRACEQELVQAKDRCARETHKLQRKIRELEDKLDRLEERRHKILKVHGLDPVIAQESSFSS